MKTLLITTALFINMVLCAQSVRPALYIEVNREPDHRAADEKSEIERYIFTFENPCNSLHYELEVQENGDLNKKKLLAGTSSPRISIIYKNLNNENSPFVIHSSKIVNKLSFEEMKSTDYQNFEEIYQKYDIYIISEQTGYKNYYVAKKVDVQPMITI
jgi:hypothetical protein